MADALDAVPWSTLEVLEGSPDDLPILLRKMRGGWTPTSRFGGPTTDPGDLLYMAIAELGSTQGTCLTSAAPDVASFLVDDVDHLEGDNAVSVLSMLSVIAHGIGWRSGKVDDELTKLRAETTRTIAWNTPQWQPAPAEQEPPMVDVWQL